MSDWWQKSWRLADEHPGHWPERRCVVCGCRLRRRYYTQSGFHETKTAFCIRATCGDPACVFKRRSQITSNTVKDRVAERPPFACPVCGTVATRPPDVKKHVWWRRKTCGHNACIHALNVRPKLRRT